MDLTEPSSPTPLDDDDDDVLEASSALSDLTNMARAHMVRQAKQDDPSPSSKACGDDEAEPLPCIEYAQAKPSAEDVGAQEKELFQMQVRASGRTRARRPPLTLSHALSPHLSRLSRQDKVASLLASLEKAALAEAK